MSDKQVTRIIDALNSIGIGIMIVNVGIGMGTWLLLAIIFSK